jgi:hypothetical protein
MFALDNDRREPSVRTTVAIVVALGGCYTPTFRDCEITCFSGACPAGLECRDTVCRAPDMTLSCDESLGDAAMSRDAPDPNADDDGDRIKNADDNCPAVSNTNQHDEDNDELGDVCDPCPPYRDFVQGGVTKDANLDSDGDGVGDGCDPNPQGGAHRIALFEGFGAPPTNVSSVPATAIWTFDTDDAIVGASPNYSRLLFTVGLASSSTHWLSARVEITGLSGAAGMLVAGVIDSVDDAAARGGACVGSVNPSGDASLVLLNSASDGDALVASVPGPISSNPFEVKLMRSVPGTMFTCRHDALVTGGNVPVTTISQPLGLHARGVTARYDWFLVVEGPAQP